MFKTQSMYYPKKSANSAHTPMPYSPALHCSASAHTGSVLCVCFLRRAACEQVTDGVLDVLRLPGRRHLLLDFATFLRAQDRDWFLRCIKYACSSQSVQAASITDFPY